MTHSPPHGFRNTYFALSILYYVFRFQAVNPFLFCNPDLNHPKNLIESCQGVTGQIPSCYSDHELCKLKSINGKIFCFIMALPKVIALINREWNQFNHLRAKNGEKIRSEDDLSNGFFQA